MKTNSRQNDYMVRVNRASRLNGQHDWNNRFVANLTLEGFKLVPHADAHRLGNDGACFAPSPLEGAPDPYLYPSLIVEKDDDTDYTQPAAPDAKEPEPLACDYAVALSRLLTLVRSRIASCPEMPDGDNLTPKEAEIFAVAEHTLKTIVLLADIVLEAARPEGEPHPLDEAHVLRMGRALVTMLPLGWAYVLLSAETGHQPDGRIVYTANCHRDDGLTLLRDFFQKIGHSEDWMEHVV